MYALASHRPWNHRTCARLHERTGEPFVLIDKPEALTLERLTEQRITTIFFPHWSHIIPPEIYEASECVIFHMTDVPYGRGGSPLQNLIVRGHEDTKISALRCVKELDAGPVYLKRPLNLNGSAEEIYLRADAVIESMIVEIIRDAPQPVPQEGEPTLFKRRRPEQGDWSQAPDLAAVFDHIRMLDAQGYPPAFLDVGPFRLEFTRASRRSDAVLADVRITLRSDQDTST
jgi:methionyl-tRNA formyltransferase